MKPKPLEINSPSLVDLGGLPRRIIDDVHALAEAVVAAPGYLEAGRSSRRVTFSADGQNDTDLHTLGKELGNKYLGLEPGPGSVALISMVTDAEQFQRETQNAKAACNWHQDFVFTEQGFFFADGETTRLILPMQAGPLCAVGHVTVNGAIRLQAVEPPLTVDREKAIQTAPTLIGADGVLVKSEEDPKGGEITEAGPNRAYIVPATSVHKTNPQVPEGRIFFQLDAVGM